jgi:Lrp/AsnC family transcriptional regulator for asnA, asnC and gidA
MPRNSAALIDDVSKSIIEQLQSDGRKPYASIGKSIGLSEAAVRQRVQKLLDTNVMQVVADALAKLEEVNYVVVCAGGFDILIEVVCEDDEKLLSILNKRIRAIPGVDSTEAFVYLKIRKQTYSWGTK